MVRLPVSRDTLVFFPLPLIALEKMPGFVTHARWGPVQAPRGKGETVWPGSIQSNVFEAESFLCSPGVEGSAGRVEKIGGYGGQHWAFLKDKFAKFADLGGWSSPQHTLLPRPWRIGMPFHLQGSRDELICSSFV
jgi:hypothetical protein